MAGPTLQLRIVSPERTVFLGEAASLVAPAYDGQVGILPGHAPFICLLGGGTFSIDLPGGGSEQFFINRGVMKVENDQVVALTEYAAAAAPADFSPSDAWLDLEEADPEVMSGGPGNPLA